MIDINTDFGKRVTRRLQEERILWLTTVDGSGRPQPRPVWFLWNGETFLIFSGANGAKMRHIAGNAHVALNFDGDGFGGDIIVFLGEAAVEQDTTPTADMDAYIEKYSEGFKRIGMTAEQFRQAYSTALRVTPTQLRGH